MKGEVLMNARCPECEGILIPTFEDEILVNKCPLCGYIEKNENVDSSSRKENSTRIKEIKEDIINNKDRFIVISYLRSIRESRGVSQKQIADIFGFTEQRYGNVERHYNAPSVVLIAEFGYLLNAPVNELYKAVKINEDMYEDMKHLKIYKSELVPYDELYIAEKRLKEIEDKMTTNEYLEKKNSYDKLHETLVSTEEEIKSIKDKKSKKYLELKETYDTLKKELDEIEKPLTEMKDKEKKAKKEYDKLLNGTSTFLKQGEVVDNYYWEKYLKMRNITDFNYE